jgi:peptide/nickel transport system substrate-binding protein
VKRIPRLRHRIGAIVAPVLAAALLAACGSQGGSTSANASGGGSHSSLAALSATGPGLTEPTTGDGSKVKGGTVSFAEPSGSTPNYISPMYSAEYCNVDNIGELDMMLYRPLYWYGDNYSPTVDYDESIGQKPVFSNGDKTVTIHLNHYKWSDGETVSARDLVFWMNLLDADPAKEWCDYTPGKFPNNVTSYRAVNATTFQMTLNRAYNPTWFLYNELSQLTPLPIAWDRTASSQKVPSPTAANLPDTTKAGATAVYNFLNAQSVKIADWGSSPVWSVVDGPWRVQSTTTNGGVTFVPNKRYTGPVKATISKFVEVPFTSESAMINEIKAQGTDSLTIAYIPAEYQPLTASLRNEGYDVNLASSNTSYFMPLNMNAPKVGKIFRQLYFRQALQHVVDQQGWIEHFLHGTAVPTYGPVPTAPRNPLIAPGAQQDLYPFSVADAIKLLRAHGWKVVPGGLSTCAKPGTGAGECGAGITKGQGISFNVDYESNVTAVQEEMEDLQSQAAKAGIKIDLTSHPVDDVAAATEHCAAGAPSCHWTAENYGQGWTYGTSMPTGEMLYYSSSVSNFSNYANAKMDRLVERTLTATSSQEAAAVDAYVRYTSEQVPVVWMPQSVGAYGTPTAGQLIDRKLGGFAANAAGVLTPENWYLTK